MNTHKQHMKITDTTTRITERTVYGKAIMDGQKKKEDKDSEGAGDRENAGRSDCRETWAQFSSFTDSQH